jgi:hypothetical protein
MILHHIYKGLNLLLYIFINLRDFWFVILINFYEIGLVKNENWFVIHESRTVISNPAIILWFYELITCLAIWVVRNNWISWENGHGIKTVYDLDSYWTSISATLASLFSWAERLKFLLQIYIELTGWRRETFPPKDIRNFKLDCRGQLYEGRILIFKPS